MNFRIKTTVFLFPALALILSACGPAGPSREDIQASAQALAGSWLRETEAALATEAQQPSATAEPSPTSQPSETPTPPLAEPTTVTPGVLPSLTPFGYMDPAQLATAQADKADQNAPLVLSNHADGEVRLVILSPVHQEYTFSKSMTIIVPEGTYTYRAWVDNKGPKNGTFSISNGDKHELRFYEDRINFVVP